MNVKVTFAALTLGAVVIGCESKQETTATPAAPAAPAATATPAAPAAPAIPAVTATPAVPTAPEATNAANAAAANTAAATAPADAAASEAQTKLNQAVQYIKDKKYDLAEKLLTELEQNKASLPANVQTQLPNARTMLTTAKAAGGAAGALPSLPK